MQRLARRMRARIGYVVGAVLAILGAVALLAANSLWLPATNPISPAAPAFQRDIVAASLVAVVAFTLAGETLFHMSRHPAAARTVWAFAGTLLCVVGTMLLANLRLVPPPAMDSVRQAVWFQAGVGLAYVLLGAGALWLRARRRAPG